MNSMEEAIFPEEIMLEIISWLPVKHVMRLRCVNKFFNTLIFDPHFVQIHLNKSTQNSQLALICFKSESHYDPEDSNNPKDWSHGLITLTIHCFLQNQFTIFHHSDPYYLLYDYPQIF
ncbi:F-box/kelch-repeat protein [Trifolium repens]|nr:F-box/kelch-repeat protein [Trifolium repens]